LICGLDPQRRKREFFLEIAARFPEMAKLLVQILDAIQRCVCVAILSPQ
jgi:hypothetical protein